MLLPVGAAFARAALAVPPLTRPVELGAVAGGAIFAGTRKARTLIATAVVARLSKARLVEIARAIARWTGIPFAALALLPWL